MLLPRRLEHFAGVPHPIDAVESQFFPMVCICGSAPDHHVLGTVQSDVPRPKQDGAPKSLGIRVIDGGYVVSPNAALLQNQRLLTIPGSDSSCAAVGVALFSKSGGGEVPLTATLALWSPRPSSHPEVR